MNFRKPTINAFVCTILFGACSAQPASNQSNLTANADARHFGIAAYAVANDGATLLDEYGLELGSMKISTPVEGRRLIHFEMVDGTTDEVEVYRPKADGTFFAPITPSTITTSAVADKALAPLFAQFGMRFNVDVEKRMAPVAAGLATDTLATTTACSGGCQTGKPWTCTTPAGCVRSANTSVGCTNPSQLPPDIFSDTGADAILALKIYGSVATCDSGIGTFCDNKLGAGNWSGDACIDDGGGTVEGQCMGRKMISEWIASCPRSTCGTVGQYDSVPRQDMCYDPGSCTFQQGTVGCTTYH